MKKNKIRIIRLCSILLVVGLFCTLLGVSEKLFNAEAASSVKWLGYTTCGTVWDVYDNSRLKIRPAPGNMDEFSGGIANNTTIPIIGYTEYDASDPWSPWYAIDIPNTPLKDPCEYTIGYVSGQFVNVPVTGMSISNANMTLKVGTSGTLSANVVPPCATNRNFSWSSNNDAVASVDGNGNITTYATGTAIISVTSEDGGHVASCECVVLPLVSSIILDKNNITIGIGKSAVVNATVDPSNAFDKSISWSSNNTAVADVDQNGNIRGKAVGSATITATANDGSGVNASCAVTVLPFVSSIVINRDSVTVSVGDNTSLFAVVEPSDAFDKSITWSSDDSSVASVDSNGKVSALSPGTAIIRARANDGSDVFDTCVYNVRPRVESIQLSETESFLYVGQSEDLTATVLPESALDRSVTWKSTDESIATVDQNGTVTAIKDGLVTISAVANDGSNIVATCTYKIEWIPSGIALSKNNSTIKETSTETLKVLFDPIAVDRDVVWSSSDEKIIKVDQNGKVTAIAPGKAAVTVRLTNGSNQSASCIYTVKALVKEITVDPMNLVIVIGHSQKIKHTISPNDVYDSSVVWESSNKEIASVDQNGYVKAKKAGVCKITVKAKDGSDIVAACNVTVNAPISWVCIDRNYLTLTKGNTYSLNTTIYPATATDKNIVWKSSNNDVVKVDDKGVVTAVNGGTAIITASSNDGSGKYDTCHITVVVLVEQIILDKDTAVMSVGEGIDINAKVFPDNATNKTLSWNSSDNAIALVDNNGSVYVRAGGVAKIKASSTDGSNVHSDCAILVDYPRDAWVANISYDSHLNIRKDCKIDSEFVTKVPYAEKLRVISPAVNGWFPVVLSDGYRGYACSDYIVFTEPEKRVTTTQKPSSRSTTGFPRNGWAGNMKQTSVLSIRKTPGGAKVTTVSYATQFTVEGPAEDGWYPVTLKKGTKGYASANYVVFNKPSLNKSTSYVSVDNEPEESVEPTNTTTKKSQYPKNAWTANFSTSSTLKIYRSISDGSVYGPTVTVSQLPWGAFLYVTGASENGYYPVRTVDGKTGYANANFIVFKKPSLLDTDMPKIKNACEHKHWTRKTRLNSDYSDLETYLRCDDCGQDVTNIVCKHKDQKRELLLLPGGSDEPDSNYFTVLWRCKDCGIECSRAQIDINILSELL